MPGYLAYRIALFIDLQRGLENAPKTPIRLFKGANFSKRLPKLADAR